MLFAVVNMYLAFSNLTENVNPNCNVLIACPGGGGGGFPFARSDRSDQSKSNIITNFSRSEPTVLKWFPFLKA